MATMSPHGSGATLTGGQGRAEATLITKESEGLRTQHLVPHDYMLIQRREGEAWIPQSIATPKTNRH